MSEEKNKRERGSGSIYQPKRSRFWWVKYYRNGKAIRESAHATDRRKAQKFLEKRLGEIGSSNFLGPSVEKIRVSELAEDMFRDYRVNGHKSLQYTEWRWKRHMEPVFAPMRAVQVTTEAVTKYIDNRKAKGAENSTINRELAALKRMFSLGYRSTPRKVYQVPVFPRLRENPPRKGFVEEKQYRQLCNVCTSPWLRVMLALGYTFGFRKAELLGMRLRQVHLLNYTVTLDPGTTKNSDGRIVKLTSETFELLKQCMLLKTPEDFVVSRRDGQPVRDFRVAWSKLTVAAELPGLLFHDLRRSAVRNMVRRGVPEVIAMRISGHRTRSIFDRYNIVNESDLADAARRIELGSVREVGHTLGIPDQTGHTDVVQTEAEQQYNQ
jgi:integrase